MWLKNPEKHQNWSFTLVAPNKEQVVVTATTKHDLVRKVINVIAQWDADGYEYSKEPRKEAARLELDWWNYIDRCIENQICKNLPSGSCYNGRGDNLHAFFEGVDSMIDSLPTPVRLAGRILTKAATLVATGKPVERLGSCRTCGGGRKFMNDSKNLGRKERLN